MNKIINKINVILWILIVCAFIYLTQKAFSYYFLVIIPILLGFGMAYIMYEISKIISAKTKLKPGISKIISIALFLFYIFFIIGYVVPKLIIDSGSVFNQFWDVLTSKETIKIIKSYDKFNLLTEPLNQISKININDLINNAIGYLKGNISQASSFAIDVISSITSISSITIFTLIIFLYLFSSMKNISNIFYNILIPRIKNNFIKEFLLESNNSMKKLSISYIFIIIENTIFQSLIFFSLGLPNAIALGAFGGLLTVIPYVGAFLTTLIAMVISLQISTFAPLIVFISMILWQQIDANFIQTRIISNAVETDPAWIIIMTLFSLVTFGGFIGFIFAFPVTVFTTSAFKIWSKKGN